MLLIIMSIFYISITIIMSSILFFKQKIDNKEINKAKELIFSFAYIFLYTILLIINYYVFNKGVEVIDKTCESNCIYYYTNNSVQIVLGLTLNIVINVLYYKLTKKTLLNLFNSKFRYIILITYSLIQYLGIIFGLLTFNGFAGIFVINNVILKVFRFISTYIPLLIYPTDMIITKIKKCN